MRGPGESEQVTALDVVCFQVSLRDAAGRRYTPARLRDQGGLGGSEDKVGWLAVGFCGTFPVQVCPVHDMQPRVARIILRPNLFIGRCGIVYPSD